MLHTKSGRLHLSFISKTVNETDADGKVLETLKTTEMAKQGCAAAPVSGVASTPATFGLADTDATKYAIKTS